MRAAHAPLLWLALALAWGLGPPAHAGGISGVRYALIVGNNSGRAPGDPLPALQHAESEARELGERLARLGHFSAERMRVLTGVGREEIFRAARELAEQHARDRAELGELPTLFTFFFTGHGLDGKLLTRDAPLTGEDVGALFRILDANLSVGFFDACFAGGLDWGELRAKGAVVTPGFNPVEALPEEVLNTEGMLWLVSSRRDELSYEDSKRGGLFTHFFIEAFTEAASDEVGVTLENMWDYARRQTHSFASHHGRQQTPEMFVRNLKTRGPLYLSFSQERTAALHFEAETAGTFLVRYGQSGLVEKVIKQPGRPYTFPVYAGEVVLTRLEPGAPEPPATQRLTLRSGGELRVRSIMGAPEAPGPGYAEEPIQGKGALPGLLLLERGPQSTLFAHVSAGVSRSSANLASSALRGVAGGRLAHGALSLGLEATYGHAAERFSAWSYRLSEEGLRLSAGYGWALGAHRLELEAGAGGTLTQLRYADGVARSHASPWLGGGLRLLVALPVPSSRAWGMVRVGGDLQSHMGLVATEPRAFWAPAASLELGLAFPLGSGRGAAAR